jgi:NAD+ kinase
MGGRVGLKRTDGKVAAARERGAEQRAPDRARTALQALHDAGDDLALVTYGQPMGADVAASVGVDAETVGSPVDTEQTTATDTREAVRAFIAADVDLVLFVGGDGTATDVAAALEETNATVPILGVPAGVKVFSGVFGVTPQEAGHIGATFTDVERAEVNDIDEHRYRQGEVQTTLKAVVTVPVAETRQSTKQLGGGSVEALAEAFARDAQTGTTYVLGPGSTLGTIKEQFGFDGTPLGVDVWRDGTVLATDANEVEILDAIDAPTEVVVSPIGGQGFIFGRGNQQISPAVLDAAHVTVVASRAKLQDTGTLRVDTGDPAIDESLRGWRKVRTGAVERRLVEVV